MCPVSFQDAYREALATAPDNIKFYDTLTISHSTFPSTFRLVRAEKDLTLDGDLYTATQFAFTLPEITQNSSTNVTVTITDIDLSIAALLDTAVETFEKIEVLYKAFLSTEVAAQAEFIAPLEAKNISINGRTLTLAAGYPDAVNKKVPAQSYRASLFTGIR